MGDPLISFTRDRHRLSRTKRAASADLPADWLPIVDAAARGSRPDWGGAVGHPLAQERVYRFYLDQYGGAAAADLTDSEIKAKATAYALEARALDIGDVTGTGGWREYGRLVDFCRSRDIEPPPVRLLLKGMASRVRCRYWWRRALRKMIARKCERGAMALGLVCKPMGQPYASNKAVLRRQDQNSRNAKAAESILFENDAGYRRSLADLAKVSVSNKSIRRGELMTRIRGCEEIADECEHPGALFTFTVPSRFHSTLRDGRRNQKHDGSDPRQAQEWLCLMWRKARSKLARRGVKLYGFRIAEPHHDGCTHWHALFWFETEQALEEAEKIIREYWLSDDGDERGAVQHRINVKRMTRGGAAGYVAKYVAKNIDDYTISSHKDDYSDDDIGPDLLGDREIKPSMRVEAWASHWGIRQFQGIGQPPVGVWRELRRIREVEARAAGVGGTIHKAWCASQRVGNVLADWKAYVHAQGGVMRGRGCRIAMRHDVREYDGLYGRAFRGFPVGVALNVKCASTVWSERRLWRRIEDAFPLEVSFAARSAATRTGVNNCTGPPSTATSHHLIYALDRVIATLSRAGPP